MSGDAAGEEQADAAGLRPGSGRSDEQQDQGRPGGNDRFCTRYSRQHGTFTSMIPRALAAGLEKIGSL